MLRRLGFPAGGVSYNELQSVVVSYCLNAKLGEREVEQNTVHQKAV